MNENQPGRGSDQFNLRFPDGMRERLKADAAANGRSLNAEIIARLEASYEATRDDVIIAMMNGLQRDIRRISSKEFIDSLREAGEQANTDAEKDGEENPLSQEWK